MIINGVKITNIKTVREVPSYALYFDGGTSEYVNVPNNASLNVSDNVSIAYWIKTSNGGPCHVFNNYLNGGGYTGYAFAYGDFGQGTTGPCYWSSAKFAWVGFNVNIYDGEWHHVVMTVSSGGTVTLYIDGVLNNTAASNAPVAYTGTKYIGNRPLGTPLPINQGYIDQLVLWNEVLTANDAADLCNGGNGRCFNPSSNWPTDGGSMGTNLMALWHFNEGSGIIANDSSGNGNTGTLTNMDNSNWATGKIQC